ncbi:unnamed protein product [Calicophoron daubneyi]|uniref:Disks large-associated protein 1 n=1 Tax=Calicophoron daubneyi TaxID=300641 RepID=A0AAV2T6W4_CALDB
MSSLRTESSKNHGPHPDPSLNSEVLSFFTPATPGRGLEDTDTTGDKRSGPRLNIVESTRPHTKTITVKCGDDLVQDASHLSVSPSEETSNVKIEANGCYRLDRLDSSVNPAMTAKLDQMAQKLGFHVPAKSHVNSQINAEWDDLASPPRWDGSPTVDFARKDNSDQIPSPPRPKRSILSNIKKRLSTPRSKSNGPCARVTPSTDPESEKTCQSVRQSSSVRIKRWFTRRLWKPKCSVTKESEATEASVASAEAVLDDSWCEDKNTQDEIDSVNKVEARQCASLDNLDAGPPSPMQTRDPNTTVLAYRVITNSAAGSESVRRNGVLENRLQWSPRGVESNESCSPIQRCDREGLQYHGSPHNPVVRGNSIRSVGSGRDQLSHSERMPSRNASGSEADALHCSPGPSASHTALPQSNQPQYRSATLAPKNYIPSYVGVSVAAFGYSGYGRNSLSSHSLLNAKNIRSSRLPPPHGTHRLHTDLRKVDPTTPEVVTTAPPVSSLPAKGSETDKKVPVSSALALHLGCLRDSSESTSSHTSPAVHFTPRDDGVSSQSLHGGQISSDNSVKRSTPSPCQSSMNTLEPTSAPVKLRRKRTCSHTANTEDQEHWQRSSLIMLAVSHASPRGHPATVSIEPDSGIITTAVEEDSTTERMSCTVSSNSPVQLTNGTDKISPTKEMASTNIAASEAVSNQDLVTAADRLSISKDLNGGTPIDGHYFLRQVDSIQAELMSKINRTEQDLKEVQMDDEVAGLLRSAVGKARLLIAEKFKQFRGLCQQNLESATFTSQSCDSTRSGEPQQLVTLVQDLDGFWAMVTLQINDVQALFQQVDELRTNNWALSRKSSTTDSPTDSKPVHSTPKSKPRRKPIPTNQSTSSRRTEDAAARAKARERLERVKREMRAKRALALTADGGPRNLGSEDVFLII